MRIAALILCCGLAACAKSVPPPQHAALAPPPAPEPPPAPVEHDDGMTVQGTLGTVSDTEVEQAFHARWDDVSRCLKEAQPHLNYLTGRVELKLRIDATGAPTAVHVQSSTLGHYGAEHCLLTLASSLRFPAPRGGSAAEFSFPFEFKPARTSSLPIDWPAERMGPSLDRGRVALDACAASKGAPTSTSKASRHKKKPRVQPAAMSAAALASAASVPSNLRMTVYILPGGKVSAAGLSADGPIDPSLASCFVAHAGQLRFDDPGGRVAKMSFEVGK